jgi:hypothetical protein
MESVGHFNMSYKTYFIAVTSTGPSQHCSENVFIVYPNRRDSISGKLLLCWGHEMQSYGLALFSSCSRSFASIYHTSRIPLLSSSHFVLQNIIHDSLLYTQVTERSPTNVENYSALSAIAFLRSCWSIRVCHLAQSVRHSLAKSSRDCQYQHPRKRNDS